MATRPSKIPPATPGAAPFVFPAAPATPAPFAVASEHDERGGDDGERGDRGAQRGAGGIADPKTEELDEPAALPAVTAAPPQEASPREVESAEEAHAPAPIVAPPPPLPRGVTITTTALFPPPMLQPPPAPQEPSGEPVAARATHPSYPQGLVPEQPPVVPEQRSAALSRPPPPSIDPVRVAPKLAPIEPALTPPPPSAAPRSAAVAAAVAAERARAERAQPAMDAAPLPPPSTSTSLNGPVAVPVGSLFGAGGALIAMVVTAFFAGRCSAQAPPQLARPSLQAIPALRAPRSRRRPRPAG